MIVAVVILAYVAIAVGATLRLIEDDQPGLFGLAWPMLLLIKLGAWIAE